MEEFSEKRMDGGGSWYRKKKSCAWRNMYWWKEEVGTRSRIKIWSEDRRETTTTKGRPFGKDRRGMKNWGYPQIKRKDARAEVYYRGGLM